MTTTTDYSYLLPPEDIELSKMFVDPNNPRITPDEPPGYADPDQLFDPEKQAALILKTYEVYNAGRLESSIIDQGWVPVDPILVWKDPGSDRYVVVEGNTRTSVLKTVRERLPREIEKLEKLRRGQGGGFPAPELSRQEKQVEKIKDLIAKTDTVKVFPVKADTAAELTQILPRLHGVRHVAPAQGWGPHAVGLYIMSLYQERFHAQFPGEELRIDDGILSQIAEVLPRKKDDIRRNIQASSAFGHFRANYDEKVQAAGNTFQASDQYFFEQILDHQVSRTAFEFGSTDLHLSEKGEEALFQWAFSKKRNRKKTDDEDDANVFQKAEDMRVWQRVANYDAKNSTTSFAKRLNVEEPSDATPVGELYAEMKLHRGKSKPIATLTELLDTMKEFKADALVDQSAHIRPLLKEVEKQALRFIAMLDAVDAEDAEEEEAE
ncbi:hypothetical protein [Sphingomonas sp.]|jgi:hypothetical protein|uniref:hypothetical protein n=1 Tax=Sphingomonas sp. TaxID=28214 RepID=UPI002E34E351|nr:hypothetical protein [Sphingomonas sp.]HEX4694479.1 hypothetical protein [Sphingomonas sp.]